MSDEVFLDPAAAGQVASDLRREASALTAGSRCVAVALPGDDAGYASAVSSLFVAEEAAATVVAAHVDVLATRLDQVARDAVRVDRFGPR